jgi:magnesium transporter
MLTHYVNRNGAMQVFEGLPQSPEDAFWFDALDPTRESELALEKLLAIEIPTREEIKDIEASSRLYAENGALYATVLFPVENAEGDVDKVDVTFVLTQKHLVTVRYQFTKVLTAFAQRCARLPAPPIEMLFLQIVEAYVEAMADLLQKYAERMDNLGRRIFRTKQPKRNGKDAMDWRRMLHNIGAAGQVIATIREGLVSFSRMASFLSAQSQHGFSREAESHIATIARDCAQLAEHATYLSNKASFLQDASLGMLNVEQNQIIKLFSVVSVVLMPPTLIASIYGMNFEFMPELKWHLGYPLALFGMAVSAIVPFIYFRWRKWF